LSVLKAEHIKFSYSKELVVNDISMEIDNGEFVSIIGPNGSGKSTLLKTLNYVYTPLGGEITLFKRPISDYSRREIAQKIAMVPQDTVIDFEFTVEDVVMMGRHPFSSRFSKEDSRDHELVYEAMENTNVLNIRDRYITEISGGERQRVFIAKALAQDTSIILLDEPTSHLDINHQLEVLELLKYLNRERGIAIVLVVHDINMAARYSDRILLMKQGRIISQGTPDEVITPENIRIAYGINTAVEKNPYTGHIEVTPLEVTRRLATGAKKIHVICGGGSGAEIMNRLHMEGHILSVGVINVGDSDWQHAKALRIDLVEEKPFSDISEKASKEAMKKILDSDYIVISDTAIGSGNLLNFKIVNLAMEYGKKALRVTKKTDLESDFTGGEASLLLESMRKLGMIEVQDTEELISEIEKIRP
jgi:iron complex transport system ATP-binding protein